MREVRLLPGQHDHVRPNDWLPVGVDLRVLMRFETGDDLHPTFGGIASDFASFSVLPTNLATFQEMTLYETGGWAADYDVTCDVTGIAMTRGRNVLWDSIDAGTIDIDMRDERGIYDPRATYTPFGPGRRIRAGIRTQVDLDTGSGWFPIGVGFVDSWEYDVPAYGLNAASVKVTAADGFSQIAQAVGPTVTAVGDGELMGVRLNRILDHADWPPSWGGRRIDTGTVPLQATTLDKSDALSEIKLTVRTEDGITYMDRDGTFVARDANYRDSSVVKLRVLGRDAEKMADTWREVGQACQTWQAVQKASTWGDVQAGAFPLPGWHPDGGPDAAGVVAMCATTIHVTDIDDDVRNDISIGRANAPDTESPGMATNVVSVRRYGRHTFSDNSFIHTARVWGQVLAQNYIYRYSDGEPRVDQISIDMLRDYQVAEQVSTLDFGDLVELVDYLPANGALHIAQMEVQGVRHDIGPTAWITTIRLDQMRTINARWDTARWDMATWY